MDLRDILSVAVASLIVLVVAHLAVFWVIRTLYPPAHAVVLPSPVPAPTPTPVFTEPPTKQVTETSQAVNVPTYETPIQLEAAGAEGYTDLSQLPGPATERNPGLAPPNAG